MGGLAPEPAAGPDAAAGVSRKAFDRHFESVHDCYKAAIEELSAAAMAEAEAEGIKAETWPIGLHRAVLALCERIKGDRTLANLAFVEGMSPDPNGMRLRDSLIAAATERLRQGAPPISRPSSLAAEASVGAACDAVQRQVAAGRPQDCRRRRRGWLFFLLLAPMIAPRLTESPR